jgi:maltose phosphorylase
MSIVEGFGGMRIKDDTLHFPQNSKRMEGYSFKINFRNQILTVAINNHKETIFQLMGIRNSDCCKRSAVLVN